MSKLFQNSYICDKRFKQIIFSKYGTNLNFHQWPFSIWSCGFVGHITYIYMCVNINSNIRKTIIQTHMPLDVFVHRILFRNEASTPHMSNPRSSQLPVFSQGKTVETVTAPTQGVTWLLHDDDVDN